MTEGLEAMTTATLGLALDAASLRQQAIAANIANHATPGYVPVRVNFEAQLEDARRALGHSGRVDEASISPVKAQLEPVLDASGAPAKIHLDAQVADMAQNAVHYQALSRALNRHFAILALATADGKR